ncbi:MAG: DegT/DnrJ/EryC1/StrS family aminotransferase [Candidatus Poribacteria bacterium]
MAKLAIKGGKPVHTTGWSGWPIIDESDVEKVADVVRSGIFGFGPRVAEFEAKFAKYMDAEYGVCTNAGTTAIQTALGAAGVGAGDEVIIPPYTFVATASAVFDANGTPVFADIDPDNYCLDPKSVEQMITNKTKAIITVHLGGCPTDMDTLMALAKKHNLMVIEDSAHAHGARYKGKAVGALGHLGCFSFQSSKNLNCGEGGIVLTNHRALYDRCSAYHNSRRLPSGAIGSADDIVGTNFRMTEFQGAMLLAQFERFEEQSNIREANGMFLTEQLRQMGGFKIPRPSYTTRHGYHIISITYEAKEFKGLSLGDFIGAMNAEGIPCSGGYGALYKDGMFQSPISRRPVTRSSDYYSSLCLPNTEELSTKTIWIFHTVLLGSRKDMEDIVEAVAKIKKNIDELI